MENVRITASVGLVAAADNPDLYLAVKNERGWDIPGGHTRKRENPKATFQREVNEEGKCTTSDPVELTLLISNDEPSTGIMVYKAAVEDCRPFSPTKEISERGFFTKEELLEKYYGDKELLRGIFDLVAKE